MERESHEGFSFHLFYSPFVVFIFNNLNNSTMTIGANTRHITSSIFSTGNAQMLNICLKAGINNIVSINAAEMAIAPSKVLLLNGFVLKIELLLSLILNTCTSCDSAKTENAIV